MKHLLLACPLIIVAALGFSAKQALSPILFEDVAKRSGIEFVLDNHATPSKFQIETMPGGIGVIDYNNDGYEDIYFANGAAIPALRKVTSSYWNRLYRNNGNGTFSDVTSIAGVAGEGYSMGVAVGDYDNDGYDDLFVCGVNRNTLYRNNRDGTFSDVTARAGIAGESNERWSISAGWFDYDNDGNLDLFVVNYCKWRQDRDPYCGENKPGYRAYCHPKFYEGLPNALYRNNGDGTFTDVSASSGIAASVGKGMAVAFADYNADGWIDAFVTNDTEPNWLFHNLGNGKFEEVGLRAGVAYNDDGRAPSSMGVDFRDLDNDGRPDLVITDLSNEMFMFYRNTGGGAFKDATWESGLGRLSLPWSGWSLGVFDLNNDGFKDVFSANGHVLDNEELFSSRTYRQANSVFANNGGGTFADATNRSAGDWVARAHRGSAFCDFDNDGRTDVVISSLNDPAELLHNVSDRGQHWLELLLTGRRSNRDAIGSKVKVVLTSGAVQHNHVTTAVGFGSSSTRRVHFGLGSETKAEIVEIRWPSGGVQILRNVEAGRLIRITEP